MTSGTPSRRSQVLSRHPRPLTSEEKAVLREAVIPLLHDLDTTGQILPDIREEAHEDRGDDAVCAWIQEPGARHGQSIRVWANCSPADQIYYLAEQIQVWAGDVHVDSRRRPWPDCPEHPGSHMLMPDNRYEAAVWCCPQSDRVLAVIGMLT